MAGEDPGILATAAYALGFFGEDIGAMIALVDRAMALDPNFARGWSLSGVLRICAGQPDTAIGHLNVRGGSVRAPRGAQSAGIGIAHF